MDFRLNPDDLYLVEVTRSFCEGRFPLKTVRELAGEGGVRRGLWHELAGTGVFNLRLPPESGGAGLSMAEAVLVFEELGRVLVPGPLVGTHLAAGMVAGAAEGEVVVGLLRRGIRPVVVENPGMTDAYLVVEPGRIALVQRDAFEWVPVETPLDPLTSIGLVDDLPSGETVITGDRDAGVLGIEATVLTAALSSGIARRTVEIGVAYAGERHQFNRPIGSFQAVKHMLADAATRAEVARAAVHAAGVIAADLRAGRASSHDARQAACSAKLLSSEAAVANALSCIQVHGGMGFTWEMDPHLFLKRAHVLASAWGTPEECAQVLAGYAYGAPAPDHTVRQDR